MTAPHKTPAPAADGAVLSTEERRKVRDLMLAATSESVALGGSLLETLRATQADRTAVFDHELLLQLVHTWDPQVWRVALPSLPPDRANACAALLLLDFVGGRGITWESRNALAQWAAGRYPNPARFAELITRHNTGRYRHFHQESPWVTLDFLTVLDDPLTLEIAGFRGDLHLPGLTALTVAQARTLARHEGWLYANGIRELADNVADELIGHESHIFLDGLTTLTHEGLAEKLASKPTVYLDDLVTVSKDAAAALSRSGSRIFTRSLGDLASTKGRTG